MVRIFRAAYFLLLLSLILVGQNLWSSVESNAGEKIVCRSDNFEQYQSGEIVGTNRPNSRGQQLSLRILPVPSSKKNRAAKIEIMQIKKATKTKKLRKLKDKSIHSTNSINAQNKFAATPYYRVAGLEREGVVVRAGYGFTEVTPLNEAGLFIDEYAPTQFSQLNLPSFPYFLTLRWVETNPKSEKSSPHLVDAVLTSDSSKRPMKIKFRCFARGI